MYPQMEILETIHCILRPITLDDTQDLFEYYSIPAVVKYLPIKVHKSISDTRRFIKSYFINNYLKGKVSHYAVVLKTQNKVIGNVGFNNIYPTDKNGEIGICINPDYWGHNLSFELEQVLVDYAFKKLNLDYVYAITYDDNIYSKSALVQLRFIYESNFKKRIKNLNNKIVKCNKFVLYKENYTK